MRITQSANAVALAIHLDTKGISDGVGADSFEPVKLTSHFTNVNLLHWFSPFDLIQVI
jgi:hypothetical protein